MRLLFISDLHLHPFTIASRNRGADRLADGLSILRQSLQYCVDKELTWLFGGDMKQTRGIWNQLALAGALDLFEEFDLVPKIMLCGNHDGVGLKDPPGSGLAPFQRYATVVSEPMLIRLAGGDTPSLACWPWVPTPTQELVDQFLSFVRQSPIPTRVLFGHALLRNAKVGPDEHRLTTEGYPPEFFGLVGPEKKRAFDWAFFGDVHKQQWLGDPVRKRAATIWYPGSPYGQNWGERELNKGALHIEYVGGKMKIQQIAFTAPRFIVLEITDVMTLDKVLMQAKRGDFDGHFVRILVSPTIRRENEFLDVLSRRVRDGARVCEVVWVPESHSALVSSTSKIHGGLSLGELMATYVDEVAPPTDLSREAILKLGRQFMGDMG